MSVDSTPDQAAIDAAKRYLAANANAVNPVLNQFWEEKRNGWRALGDIVSGAADAYALLTADGKKIRAGLVKLGYDACCSASSPCSTIADGVLRAAGSVEILHNAFLIHDDIVDHSDLRRNAPTVHRRYAEAFRYRFDSESEALDFGAAVALNFGDKGQALAQELLLSAGFPEGVLLRAVTHLSSVTTETVAGQLLDVAEVPLPELTAEQVLRIHEYKTAHYTVMLPLVMGAVLAGVDDVMLAKIRAYSIPIGIAFQIHDDILGLYGDQDVLGKPVDSDVKEGKKTLLMVHAYEAASPPERELLCAAHGNPDLSPSDLERVRTIVRKTGALARSEEIAREFVHQGKQQLAEIELAPEWKRILAGLADYFIVRRY